MDDRPARPSRAARVVAAAVGAVVGFAVSAVSLYGALVAGAVVIVTGSILIAMRRQSRGVVLAFGIGLILGALVYIGLGLLQPDGPHSGGGGSR